jgi:hypothetical protein
MCRRSLVNARLFIPTRRFSTKSEKSDAVFATQFIEERMISEAFIA